MLAQWSVLLKACMTIALVCSQGVYAADKAPDARQPPFDKAALNRAVGQIAAEIRMGYVFPEKGNRAADAIESALAAKAYDDITDPRRFADRLTGDLQANTGDSHMRVIFGSPFPPKPASPPPNDVGFERVERLEGNLGYIRLNRFAVPEQFKAPADKAMAQVADTDALIIDMRGNGGGHPGAVAYLTGFFLDQTRPVHINSIIWRNRGTENFRTEEFWTTTTPTQYLNKPVYVLVGPETYSGGEEFAYDVQVLKRATIVGTKTRGGANPGGPAPVGSDIFVVVPSGRAENPMTKTNWEGVGISPNIEVPAEAALDTAIKLALARR